MGDSWLVHFSGNAVSERIKAALAAAKERGVELGKNGKMLAVRNRKEAEVFARDIAGRFDEYGVVDGCLTSALMRQTG